MVMWLPVGVLSLIWNFNFNCYGAPLGNDISSSTDIDAVGLSYLLSKGYYEPAKSTQVGQIEDNQKRVVSALKDFQRYASIPVTGKLDDATREMMAKPRCGMPDKLSEDKSRRKRRYLHQGTTWKNPKLTWSMKTWNNDGITQNEIRSIMQRSFAKWQDITNLEFTEQRGTNPNSDIYVSFERGTHGDTFPFDGNGGTLAHAFYPLENKGIAGDVHFDDDEIFTINDEDRSKKKLLWIAVHELGHSIGLSHSDVTGAVMYPWYQHFPGNDFSLTEDDRLGAQTLYGSRVRTTKTPVSTITPQAVGKSKCANHVGGALLWSDKRTYVFNGDVYYVLFKEPNMGVEEGPLRIESLFAEVSSVDAIFRRPKDDAIIIFHGEKFTVYDGETIKKKESKDISVGFHGLPDGFGDVDASFVWAQDRKLYIFKGDEYYRFSERFNSDDYTIDLKYPKKIASNWIGLPNSIDAVFKWANGETYFFKDDLYYRWNTRLRRVNSGYPQKVTNSFLECTKGSFLKQREADSASNVRTRSLVVLLLPFVLTIRIIM